MTAATVRPADFKAHRQRNGSQLNLAQAIGCSDVMIHLIEHGRRNPSLPLLLAAAEALGVGLEEIADVHVTPEQIEVLSKAVS